MQKLILGILLFTLLGACTAEVVSCDPEDRAGAYQLELIPIDDGCQVESSAESLTSVSVIGDPTPEVNCEVTYVHWSNNYCSLVKSGTCYYLVNGIAYARAWEVVTDQTNNSGSRLEGAAEMQLRDEFGNSCTSVFEVIAVRQ